MNTRLKKTGALLLLLIAAGPVLLLTGLWVKQKIVQHQMEERLENSHLHTITTNIANIKWIEKGEEVVLNGERFDVKSYVIEGNQITLTGLYDTEEQQIKQEAAGVMNNKQNNSIPLNQLLLKLIFSPAINNTITTLMQITNTANTIKFGQYSEPIALQYKPVATPPPNS